MILIFQMIKKINYINMVMMLLLIYYKIISYDKLKNTDYTSKQMLL